MSEWKRKDEKRNRVRLYREKEQRYMSCAKSIERNIERLEKHDLDDKWKIIGDLKYARAVIEEFLHIFMDVKRVDKEVYNSTINNIDLEKQLSHFRDRLRSVEDLEGVYVSSTKD